jgi:hypothetical protein
MAIRPTQQPLLMAFFLKASLDGSPSDAIPSCWLLPGFILEERVAVCLYLHYDFVLFVGTKF